MKWLGGSLAFPVLMIVMLWWNCQPQAPVNDFPKRLAVTWESEADTNLVLTGKGSRDYSRQEKVTGTRHEFFVDDSSQIYIAVQAFEKGKTSLLSDEVGWPGSVSAPPDSVTPPDTTVVPEVWVAEIGITGDDEIRVWFNDTLILADADWKTWWVVERGAKSEGRNVILVEAVNAESAAGVLCRIVYGAAGADSAGALPSHARIVSDGDWEVSRDGVSWQPATMIARYGLGKWAQFGNVDGLPVTGNSDLFWIWDNQSSNRIWLRREF